MHRSHPTFRILALLVLALGTVAAADPAKPIKVYLLSGQSNMSGRGTTGDLSKPAADQRATLVRFIKDPANAEKYAFLTNGPQKNPQGWTVREDVFISYGAWPHDGSKDAGKHGPLGPNYGGFRNRGFGPELGIGHVLGDFHDETVLLVKGSFGGCSLAKDLRPPSAGGTTGEKYRQLLAIYRATIEHLPEIIPGATKDTPCELVGFFWNQGESDMSPEAGAEYRSNLVHLLKDLRRELNAPDMKIVIATTGFGGFKKEFPNDAARKASDDVINAQLALPELPEFKGSAVTVETRPFYRPQDPFGGNNQTIHWHANGESYWLVGEAMGQAMQKLVAARR